MEYDEPETEIEENIEILYDIPLLDEEYELLMKINNSLLEFKLQKTNIIDGYCYKKRYNLEDINKLLHTTFERIKDAFNFFDNLLKEKQINLIKSNEDIINLNFQNTTQNIETNVEIEKVKLTNYEMNFIFLKEINSLKNKLNLSEEKIKEKDNKINDLKEKMEQLKQEQETKINEIENKYEKKISDIENLINPIIEKENERNEIIKFNKLNDNVNLVNDFTEIDVENMRIEKNIANNLNIKWMKSVAVYKIIRNNEANYEIAYPENLNIKIYNILSNKKIYTIKKAHKKDINMIKHYYDSLRNHNILLTSSYDKSVKLWNISSNPIINIMHITDCFDGSFLSQFCIMFNAEDYYILGGSVFEKKNIWDKDGKLMGNIKNSELFRNCVFIETSYINDAPYILLSGAFHSECYDYNNNIMKIYKSKNKYNIHNIVNLFKNDNEIYLISGDQGGNIIIFDFESTNEISSISVGGGICSINLINKKYILVGNDKKELNVIDFDNKSIVKNYREHNKDILGIEKIKTYNKGEYIITYDFNKIKIWK